jgi:hypothetical protein
MKCRSKTLRYVQSVATAVQIKLIHDANRFGRVSYKTIATEIDGIPFKSLQRGSRDQLVSEKQLRSLSIDLLTEEDVFHNSRAIRLGRVIQSVREYNRLTDFI